MSFLAITALGSGFLLLVQSAWSLLEGFRFLRLVSRGKKRPVGRYTPRAGMVIPCRGWGAEHERNLRRYLSQQYPDYELVVVVTSADDHAYEPLKQSLAGHSAGVGTFAPKATLVLAGFHDGRGEKVNNLLHGLEALGPDVEVLVFADIDAGVSQDWLRSLLAPLGDPAVTASTGFRWYLPGEGLASQLRAAWDTSVATLMQESSPKFAWGGSMAIRARDFRRLRIAERYWANTVSDDYTLTRAIRQAGERIVFEPRCLAASREELTFKELLRWTTRQIILTRIYAPRLWVQGLAAHLLYGAAFATGGIALLVPHISAAVRLVVVGALLVILVLGIGKGWIRSVVARELFSCEMPSLERLASRYWQLAPIVPWIMLWNFLRSGFTRRIDWCGTRYEMDSQGVVKALRRNAT